MPTGKIFADTAAIVLAAGKGSRMKSALPKVLHLVKGKTMIERVVTSLRDAAVEQLCVVLSENLSPFSDFLHKNQDVTVCVQSHTNGTAGAAAVAGFGLSGVGVPPYAKGHHLHGKLLDAEYVLICAGDMPAIDPDVLREFIEASQKDGAPLSVLAMKVPHPAGYGRLVMGSDQKLERIVEETEADESERRIDLVNTGILLARKKKLFELLSQIGNSNNQEEYFLTDCIEQAGRSNVYVYTTKNWQAFQGINTQEQLRQLMV